VKQAVKSGLSLVLMLSFLISQSGCTYALWNDGYLDVYKEPAPNPDLHLFHSQERDDFLVVYREQSDRSNAIRTRAYWLYSNQNRLNRELHPIFVSKKPTQNLPVIPVFSSWPDNADTNHSFYAVYGTNQTFTLFSGARSIGSYTLPAYPDRRSTAEKVALTPVTVTIDAVVITAAVVLVLYCCNNNNP
jgi:hypothetical protein